MFEREVRVLIMKTAWSTRECLSPFHALRACRGTGKRPMPPGAKVPSVRRAAGFGHGHGCGANPIGAVRYGETGPTSLPARSSSLWNTRMFVGHEVLLEVSFAIARERLVRLAEDGALISASEDAYGRGTADLTRVGAAGLSKLVRVQLRELSWMDRSAGLAIRWEATGPAGGLFPVLDADLRLASTGDQVTLLTLAGAYRPPLGPLGEALDRVILHRVADATIRHFAVWVAARITGESGAAEATTSNGAGASPPDLPG